MGTSAEAGSGPTAAAAPSLGPRFRWPDDTPTVRTHLGIVGDCPKPSGPKAPRHDTLRGDPRRDQHQLVRRIYYRERRPTVPADMGRLEDPGKSAIAAIVAAGAGQYPVCLFQLDRSRRTASLSRFLAASGRNRVDAGEWQNHGTGVDAVVGQTKPEPRSSATWPSRRPGRRGAVRLNGL